MATKTLGIIVNGATGGICSRQHIRGALAQIRAEGGLPVGDDMVVPRLLLAGRNEARLAEVARTYDIAEWTTDLDAALADPDFPVLFDAAATHLRHDTLRRAIAAGKHIYTEKPVAPSVADGLALLREAEAKGLKHGAVEDKLFLPGFRKLAGLMERGFFGRVVGFRLEFGWWVFDGIEAPSQRPSWNYTRAGGGGLISDMHPHWRYTIEGILGPIRRVAGASWTAQPERADEEGRRYAVDVEDAVTTMLELESGACGSIQSSWATRVRRDDLVTFQADGVNGSAVAGLTRCWTQDRVNTPKPVWNPDQPQTHNFFDDWAEVPDRGANENGFKLQWEMFLRHIVEDTPWKYTLLEGAKGVQLAELGLESWRERKWLDVPALTL